MTAAKSVCSLLVKFIFLALNSTQQSDTIGSNFTVAVNTIITVIAQSAHLKVLISKAMGMLIRYNAN